MCRASSKVLTRSQLLMQQKRHKARGEQMVFTNGCFDLLHWGHLRYLEAARSLGDYLVVGINCDSTVEQLKGKLRPLFSQKHRGELLAGLWCVDYVTIFSEATAEQLIDALEPEIYVKGGDWKLSNLPEAPLVQSYGGRVELLPGAEGLSTSRILEAVARGETKL